MRQATETDAYIALGGNLGNPRQTLITATANLARHPQIRLLAASSLYRTPAVGGPSDQPDYLNAVLKVSTSLTAAELLSFCQQLENASGRTREVRWGARTLDLDLLFVGRLILETERLQLPHPRLQERHFVLLPLVEIAADFIHPQLGCSMTDLLDGLPAVEGISRLEDDWINHD